MRIVFAHDHKFRKIDNIYYSTGGLSDKVLTRYTRIFGNIDVIARVIPKQDGDEGLSKIVNENVNIISCNFYGKEKAKMENYIQNCDAVIARLPSFMGNLAIHYAKKYSKPYLIEVVGCAWDAMWNHSKIGKIIAPYMYFKTKNLVKDCSDVLYVTNTFLQKRYRSYGNKIGCSDVELKEISDTILDNRKKYILQKKDKIVIGTLGAIDVKYKGQEYIIQAISMLNKKGYNYEYELVGGGDNSYLKSVAEKFEVLDKVKFLGTIPHKEVFDWLDNIDIYAQPSKVEGLPRALVEAMSRACPAIGSDAGGIPELLGNEAVFKKGNVINIYEILINLTQEKLYSLSEENFEKSKEFESDRLEKRRSEFYKTFSAKI